MNKQIAPCDSMAQRNELKFKAKAAAEVGNANELKNLNETYLQLRKSLKF